VIAVLTSPPLCSQQPGEFLTRTQPSVPEGWTETPFQETARQPVLSEREQQRGYLVFHRPITESVYPNTLPLSHERLETLVAFAAPGEFEPVTLSLYPVRDLKNLTVRCSELTSGENRIAASEIDIRLLTFWNIGYPKVYGSRLA
jgi:hypothetical protein